MNMLALTWGETTIVVDAGVMFPDPELLGVDRIIPDLTYLQQNGGVARAGADPRPRGSHRRRAARGAARPWPDLRHAAHPRARRAQAAGARARAMHQLVPVRPRDRSRSGRSRSSSSASRTACPTAWRWPFTRRSASSSTPATSRSTRRRSTASISTCTASRSSAPRGSWRSSPTAPTSTAAGSPARKPKSIEAFEEIFTSAGGRLIVAAFSSSIYRMQILVDLAAQFDRKVAFVGRGMIENSQIAQRLGYLRIPAGVQIRDSDVDELPGAGRPVPQHRLAGRADVGAVADRHRRPSLREARPGRHRGAVGAVDPRQREGDRPRR